MNNTTPTDQITENDYDPPYTFTMNADGDDPEFIHTPPVHTGYSSGPPPEDIRYTELVAQANAGTLSCQHVLIPMYRIRPYSDYSPRIDSELRDEFASTYGTSNPMGITVYEEAPGQFTVGSSQDNHAIYELYKRQSPPFAFCVVLGPFTKVWAVEPLDRPFQLKLTVYDPRKTAHHIAKRIHELQNEKMVSIDAIIRLAGLTPKEYAKLTDPIHPEAPSMDTLERVAKVLGVTSAEILPF